MPLRFSPARGAAVLISSTSRGETGSVGAAATIAAGTTTTGAEGTIATVANSGTSSAATFDFTIPRGAVPAVGFNFDTSTSDADPGAGDVRFNNATPASVTQIYFDNADRDGNTVTSWLDSFDDSTNTAKGTLVCTPAATPSAKLIFSVSGTVTDGTGYRKVTVAHVAGTTLPSSGVHLAWTFSRAGDKGADGIGTGDVTAASSFGTDNVVVRSDGTGKGVQASGIAVDDSNNVSGVGTLGCGSITSTGVFSIGTSNAATVGSIELGHATDTTITRVSAGLAAVEGATIATLSTAQTFSAKQTFGAAIVETPVALSDGATPALDASLGNIFTLAAAGNRTIAVPSNATSGQKIVIRHLASGAARTLALNTGAGGFRFGTDVTALTETESGKYDYIGCIYNSTDSKWDVVAYSKGYG